MSTKVPAPNVTSIADEAGIEVRIKRVGDRHILIERPFGPSLLIERRHWETLRDFFIDITDPDALL